MWLPLATWAALALFHPEVNFDIWLHLRVGEAVLTEGIPHVDAWSATAQGRPFIAHEWLAGVVFAELTNATDGVALTLLRCWIAALLVLCLWLVCPASERDRPLTLVVAAAVLLLVLPRAVARPHLFSLLFVALHVVGIEGWRARRRPLALAWLVPLAALWANLHGAFLLGPVLLCTVGVGALLTSRFPSLCGEEEAFTPRQALTPFVIAALCLLAALVNPYGADLYAFSLEMAFENDYLKRLVSEWKPFWVAEHRGSYQALLFPAFAVAAWSLVLLRARRAGVVDVLLLALATVLAARAWRFLPYFGLLAFVPTVRALSRLLRPRATSWRATALAAAPALLLLAVTWVHGPGFKREVPLLFGAGLAEHPAADLVAHARAAGIEGAVLNEYEHGAYLLYAGRPGLEPFIDARIDIYGEQLVDEWFRALQSPDAALAAVRRHDVRAAILQRNRAAVIDALLAEPGWRVVAVNERDVLLARHAG